MKELKNKDARYNSSQIRYPSPSFFIKNDYNYTFKNTENNTKVKVIKLHRWNNACLPMEKVFVCMALYLYL